MCQNQATASDLSLYDIFVAQKNPLLKISNDVIACDLWFGPSAIKNTCCAYAFLSHKNYFKEIFL